MPREMSRKKKRAGGRAREKKTVRKRKTERKRERGGGGDRERERPTSDRQAETDRQGQDTQKNPIQPLHNDHGNAATATAVPPTNVNQ